MFIDETNYSFYEAEGAMNGPYLNKSEMPLFQYNLDDDMEILIALSGISENAEIELMQYLEELSYPNKRKIINTMFALNGYSFVTEEWQNYFKQYSWYKPNKDIKNDRSILNIRQQRLLDYLDK
jgi:hypothetical protein